VGVSAGVPHAGEKEILAPDARRDRFLGIRKIRVVSAGDEERAAVGRWDDRVRPVLAAARKPAKELHLIELVVAVRIASSIEPLAPFATHDVEAVERPEEAVRAADIEIDP